MPTAATHAFFSIALGKTMFRRKLPMRLWVMAAGCSALADLDTIGLRLGVPYARPLGHRGLTHSLAFALVLSVAATWLARRWCDGRSPGRWRLWASLLPVCASHGLLDAMTDGGLGIAFLAPFDNSRYFLAFRPIEVAPIGLGALLSRWGLRVLLSELVWIWLPMIVLWALAWVLRRRGRGAGECGVRS